MKRESLSKARSDLLIHELTTKMNQLPVMLLIELLALLKRKVAMKSFVLYSAWGKSLLIMIWALGKGHVNQA